ncbi:MAG: multicopper oxidase domain-containing protein [Methylococcaceae bacterium]|nr:multicopper oxidase domain-containing protein [Methylococcaceae bacterium]
MLKNHGFDRRRFLQIAGIGALTAVASPRWLLAAGNGRYAREASADFHPDVEIEITATVTTAPILPGKPTKVWKYEGKLLKGLDGTVVPLPGTHLGATIVLAKGQKVRLYFKNDLPEPNIIHCHGLHVPQVMDGHPMYDVPAGSGYVYEFQVDNPAGTYMYHAHTHEATGRHVYNGLAGLILVTDAEEKSLNLPSGECDQPIVLQDRSFDADNQLRYVQNMRDRHMGFLGDEMIVNGKRHFVLPVATRPYRLRLLNGSNSRIYKLAWDDGTPLTVIGTDGHLLEKPVTRQYLMLAPGERAELFADFTGRKVGSELVMKSLPFSGAMPGHGMGGMMGMMNHGGGQGMMGMMHGGMMNRGGDGPARRDSSGAMNHGGEGAASQDEAGSGMMGHGARAQSAQGEDGHDGMDMMGTSALPLGSEYPLFKVHIMREETDTHRLPERLVKIERYQRSQAENPGQPRHIRISMAHMKWLLNGREFEMSAATPEETVKVNTLQVIEFDNGYSESSGMGMMSGLPHPMHIHGQQFQIIERVVREDSRKDYATVSQGFVDDGWKDVVLVMPGEKVTLLKRFDDYKGLFLYHCHNLEHEEMGMMRNFNVV